MHILSLGKSKSLIKSIEQPAKVVKIYIDLDIELVISDKNRPS